MDGAGTVYVAGQSSDNAFKITPPGPPRVMTVKVDAVVVDAVGDPGADPGDEIEYTITLENTGNSAAEGVVFTDTVDLNTTIICGSVSPSLGSGDSCTGSTLTIDIGVIDGAGGPDDHYRTRDRRGRCGQCLRHGSE